MEAEESRVVKWNHSWSFSYLETFLYTVLYNPGGEGYENNKTFPKILICSHSMHSKKKLERFYPNVTLEHLIKFYGTASSKLQKEFWNKLVISNVSVFHSLLVGYSLFHLAYHENRGRNDGRMGKRTSQPTQPDRVSNEDIAGLPCRTLPVRTCRLSPHVASQANANGFRVKFNFIVDNTGTDSLTAGIMIYKFRKT